VVTNIDPGVALTILDRALSIQVTYGAVMLSFLGMSEPTAASYLRLKHLIQALCTGEWNLQDSADTKAIPVSSSV
jgi:hypothetical protein